MSPKSDHHTPEDSIKRRHELSDIHFGRVLVTGIGILGLMVGGLVYSGVVESMFSDPEGGREGNALVGQQTFRLPPEPRIEADPNSMLRFVRQNEERELNTYRWISRDSGIVQIPVDRAMKIVVEKEMLKSR